MKKIMSSAYRKALLFFLAGALISSGVNAKEKVSKESGFRSWVRRSFSSSSNAKKPKRHQDRDGWLQRKIEKKEAAIKKLLKAGASLDELDSGALQQIVAQDIRPLIDAMRKQIGKSREARRVGRHERMNKWVDATKKLKAWVGTINQARRREFTAFLSNEIIPALTRSRYNIQKSLKSYAKKAKADLNSRDHGRCNNGRRALGFDEVASAK